MIRSISIIIPCLNEEENISKIYKEIKKFKFKKYEIIFVDDGSTDSSRKEIIKLKHKYKMLDTFLEVTTKIYQDHFIQV